MSNANPNFVSELVMMAKAFEELPVVKQALDSARHDAASYADMVTQRELSITKLKQEIDDLHATTRKLEAERDDAELRFLESEDRTSSALSFIKTIFGSAGSLIQALEPPAPVSIPTPPAEPEVIFEEPINISAAPTDATMGQSEPLPTDQAPLATSATSALTTNAGPLDAGNTANSEEAPAAPTDASTPGPYTDKLYVNEPHWMPLDTWLAGGGTEANYYYRH